MAINSQGGYTIIMKKVLSVLLALLMVLSLSVALLVSCNEETPQQGGGTTTPPPGGPTTVERDELIFPEEYDFSSGSEKTTFHILQWSVDNLNEPGTDWIPWEEGNVDADDGDLISKIVLDRNAIAEETYGVDITAEYVGVNAGYTTRLRNDKMSTSNEFQLLTIRSLQGWELVGEELVVDMNQYADQGILHTDKPW